MGIGLLDDGSLPSRLAQHRGGVKPTFIQNAGHDVINPALHNDDFDAAVQAAQAEYDQHQPDVIVGTSRGGAVAMNIDSGDTPFVLLCPAWRNWGTATTVKPNTTILHSCEDDTIPFEDSEQLIKNSNLPETALILTGHDHRLADSESLERMLDACWDDRYHAIHESSHAVVGLRSGLTPRKVTIGRTHTGTSGGVTFCSQTAVVRTCRARHTRPDRVTHAEISASPRLCRKAPGYGGIAALFDGIGSAPQASIKTKETIANIHAGARKRVRRAPQRGVMTALAIYVEKLAAAAQAARATRTGSRRPGRTLPESGAGRRPEAQSALESAVRESHRPPLRGASAASNPEVSE